ncbi:MAG: hypothetical protein AB7O68_26495 [Pirellulales bacterium]
MKSEAAISERVKLLRRHAAQSRRAGDQRSAEFCTTFAAALGWVLDDPRSAPELELFLEGLARLEGAAL